MPVAIRISSLKLVERLRTQMDRILRLLRLRSFGTLILVLGRLRLNC
jgi:hypothetical protein